jgi:dihydrolipoamide dehydrogenase
MEEYDFIVVGSGSGLEVANAAANHGQSVAVVEKGPLGGTCLNRGCIPSKMLLDYAEVAETIERSGEFNIDASIDDVAFADIVREVTLSVGESADAIRRGITSSPQHDLYQGTGRFVDERTLEMATGEREGERLRAETVLVAAGTRPGIPDVEGIDAVDYLTSTEALQLETPPDHLVIVGAGYIAAELSHFFGTFGNDVTIVGRRPHLLPDADPEVAAWFTERYADRFDVYTGYEATAVSESGGEVTVDARPFAEADGAAGREAGEGGAVSVTGDELLVATGRVPNTDVLNVEAAGIETDERGFVETEEYLRTSADGVWALGDVVGEYLLKHNANHEARAVARNLYGEELQPVDYSAMPFAVFASPEVAGVGATADELRASDAEFATATYDYGDTARGDAMKTEGFVKVLLDLDGSILGCHIVGPEASNLIQEVVVAMTAGSGTVREIRESVHIHPALSEVVSSSTAPGRSGSPNWRTRTTTTTTSTGRSAGTPPPVTTIRVPSASTTPSMTPASSRSTTTRATRASARSSTTTTRSPRSDAPGRSGGRRAFDGDRFGRSLPPCFVPTREVSVPPPSGYKRSRSAYPRRDRRERMANDGRASEDVLGFSSSRGWPRQYSGSESGGESTAPLASRSDGPPEQKFPPRSPGGNGSAREGRAPAG